MTGDSLSDKSRPNRAQRKTLFVDSGVHAKLKAVSALSGRSLEDLTSEILEKYLAERWKALMKGQIR